MKRILCLLLLAILSSSAIVMSGHESTSAASLADWRAGNIIEDAVFTNTDTMDAAAIQAFLNSKVPVCDTNGTSTSEFGGGTRAQWAAARGYYPPFTCLKDFSEGGKTAAQIIYDASQEFSINPQILLVLLQKEQGLVTDTWPIPESSQYRTATGYGCPDTAACDSQYYGLTNQIRWSSRMFRAIMNASPTWYTPYTLGLNYIRYSPDINCGGSNVFIENRATQALYNYTPYQPNDATLAAGFGQATCGAYGNRNFYHYFVDWFGSVRAVNGSIVISNALTTSQQNISRGDTINAWFEIRNTANIAVNVGGMGVCARLNGVNYDFGFSHQNTIAPNGTLIFSYNKRIDASGTLNLFICSYNESLGGWASLFYPYNTSGLNRSLTYSVADNPAITTGLAISPTSPAAGQQTTATFTIRNSGTAPVNVGSLTVAGRSPTGANVDFPIVNDVIVPAGGEYTYSQSRVFSQPGSNYRFFIANWNGVWSTTYPSSGAGNTIRSTALSVKDNPLLTAGLVLSQPSPLAGQLTTVTFTIRNDSASPINIGSMVVAGRGPGGTNVDFPIVNDVIVPAGGEYVYSQSRVFSQIGTHTFFIANWNGVWSVAIPKSASSDVARTLSVQVR